MTQYYPSETKIGFYVSTPERPYHLFALSEDIKVKFIYAFSCIIKIPLKPPNAFYEDLYRMMYPERIPVEMQKNIPSIVAKVPQEDKAPTLKAKPAIEKPFSSLPHKSPEPRLSIKQVEIKKQPIEEIKKPQPQAAKKVEEVVDKKKEENAKMQETTTANPIQNLPNKQIPPPVQQVPEIKVDEEIKEAQRKPPAIKKEIPKEKKVKIIESVPKSGNPFNDGGIIEEIKPEKKSVKPKTLIDPRRDVKRSCTTSVQGSAMNALIYDENSSDNKPKSINNINEKKVFHIA